MRKLNINYVKEFIAKDGYVCLSNEYKNSSSKLELLCPNEHKFFMSFATFRAGHRCAKCFNNLNKKKITIEYIKEYALKYNFICLSDQYINYKDKLRFMCPKKHIFEISFGSFKNSNSCAECSNRKKYTIEYVKDFISKTGYKCLSNSYKNTDSKLEILCPNGHIINVSFYQFKKGNRCAECLHIKKHTLQYVKEYVEQYNYICLNEEYINCETKLDLICPKKHNCRITFNNFRRNRRCGECNKITLEDIKELAIQENCICTDGYYINSNTKMNFICSEGHKFFMKPSAFKEGHRCGICSKSKTERTIRYMLEQALGVSLKSILHPDIINPLTNYKLELDGFNSEINFAFEYQGPHHYKKCYRKKLETQLFKDNIKVCRCKDLNIKLLIIPTIPDLLPVRNVCKFLIDSLNKLGINLVTDIPDFRDTMRKILRGEIVES
jgi:hypothetical protein